MIPPKLTEQDLLDENIRSELIKGFQSQENECRKAEAFKAYECLKDKTIHYVLELLLKQFDIETVYEMQYAMTNISILRKVIDKLAKVYNNGVKRTLSGNEAATQDIEEAAKYLDINCAMQKANKYFRTFKNTLVGVLPYPNEDGTLFDFEVKVKPPFHYDAVVNRDRPHDPLAYVFSDYYPARRTLYWLGDAGQAHHGNEGEVRKIKDPGLPKGAYVDDEKREYVWWCKRYHFTTNGKGVIISDPAAIDNPILMNPWVNLAGDQDDEFWAKGGEDLVDTGIKINTLLTNMEHIGVSQGHGQLYMTGSNLPKSIKVGPNTCVQIEVKEGDPPATIGYLNANPQLAELKSNIEMLMAMMLTTNNLSTSGFSTSLDSGKDFASGIALMIDKSESVEDINEQSKIFIEKEPDIWEIASAWLETYRSLGLLSEEAAQMNLPPPAEMDKLQVQFPSPRLIMTESEQLDVLQKRKDMGLNTMVEILMRDDPSLTTEMAQAKLAQIEEEKAQRMESMTGGLGGNQGQESNGVSGQDGNGAGPVRGSSSGNSGAPEENNPQ